MTKLSALDMVSSTNFKAKNAEYLRKVEDGRAVGVTLNGSTVAVVVSPSDFEKLRAFELSALGAQ
ncbi:MAG: type II toxin-antitoxin system prevent-host-death family antitoxin, partial [Lentisphaeria bacterium]|nr:type II toxin-antitoxin system prevent-host-death family antitoxin [Lentisphaeria bacterium]